MICRHAELSPLYCGSESAGAYPISVSGPLLRTRPRFSAPFNLRCSNSGAQAVARRSNGITPYRAECLGRRGRNSWNRLDEAGCCGIVREPVRIAGSKRAAEACPIVATNMCFPEKRSARCLDLVLPRSGQTHNSYFGCGVLSPARRRRQEHSEVRAPHLSAQPAIMFNCPGSPRLPLEAMFAEKGPLSR